MTSIPLALAGPADDQAGPATPTVGRPVRPGRCGCRRPLRCDPAGIWRHLADASPCLADDPAGGHRPGTGWPASRSADRIRLADTTAGFRPQVALPPDRGTPDPAEGRPRRPAAGDMPPIGGPLHGGRGRGRTPQLAALTAELRAAGHTWVQIAAVLRRRFRLRPMAAIRLAHGWSQADAAAHWNRRWPDDLKTFKQFSYWESWPGRSSLCPRLPALLRMAQLYQCAVGDLLDQADFRHLDHRHLADTPPITTGRRPHLPPGQPGAAAPTQHGRRAGHRTPQARPRQADDPPGPGHPPQHPGRSRP